MSPGELLSLLLILLPGLGMLAGLLVQLTRASSHSRRPVLHPTGEPRLSFRLILPRDGSMSVSQVAAWFSAFGSGLRPGDAGSIAELCSRNGELELRLTAPASGETSLRGQLAAWAPEVRLEQAPDALVSKHATWLPLRLEQADIFPLVLPSASEPDPLLGLIGALTQDETSAGLRLDWGPAPADWTRWAPLALAAMTARRPLPPRAPWLSLHQALHLLRGDFSHREPEKLPAHRPDLQRAALKLRQPVFGVRVSLWAAAPKQDAAARRVQDLAAMLTSALRSPAGNTLVPMPRRSSPAEGPCLALTAEELALLFHVPAAGHPRLSRETSRKVAPPPRLLTPRAATTGELTLLGEALAESGPQPFGLTPEERRLHAYVVGKTGTGKSTLLLSLARQDLERGRGLGLIDPHGDLAERVLALVPPGREADVLYFNPADRDYPVGFNLLAAASAAERPRVASAVVGVFKKLYGASWGPRLEYFLRNAVLALLETPSPSLLALPRLLTDTRYRTRVLQHVRDPLIRSFFRDEFDAYASQWRAEAISPILNKVGQFLASPVVRHVVGQSRPGFPLGELLDRNGIFIANLSSGKIGEDNAALLGGLLVAGFQGAALARADQPEGERRDFPLLVDEFQHFANEAFAGILSEARKYRLSLVLSHQYLDQLPSGISDAVFGNVGSYCVFRVGAADAPRLVRELAPQFDAEDLVHLPNHRFCARLTHGGETLPAFSARTLPPPDSARDLQPLIARSRARWARPRTEVELEIADFWEGRDDG